MARLIAITPAVERSCLLHLGEDYVARLEGNAVVVQFKRSLGRGRLRIQMPRLSEGHDTLVIHGPSLAQMLRQGTARFLETEPVEINEGTVFRLSPAAALWSDAFRPLLTFVETPQ